MRSLRALVLVAAAAAFLTAALTTSLRASAPGTSVAVAAQATAGDAGNYVGPGSCSAVACHGAIRPMPGARILQTEYSTWVSQDRHARATELPANPFSQRMAHILELGTRQ